jgi:uncharacterized protein
MKLYRFEDVIEFYDRTQPYLLQHEAEHYILLGFLEARIKFPEHYSESPYLATVEEDGKIIAVAVCLFPQSLSLSLMPDLSAVQLIVEDLYAVNSKLLNLGGFVAETQAFAAAWAKRSGQSYHLKIELCLYQLDRVKPVSGVKGHLRLAEESDYSLLVEWVEAFTEVVPVKGSESAEQHVADRLSQNALYIWQDRVPVTLVGTSRTVAGNGIIRSVYTPPEHRHNGYATASVAAVSQILLDQGCRFCYLTTNLKNSTSNHVYQTVGYQTFVNANRYTFE